MLSALSTKGITPNIQNRHQKDRLVIRSQNPAVPMLQSYTAANVAGAAINASGQFTNQQGISTSEAFGASASINGCINSVAIGPGATIGAGGGYSVCIGRNTSVNINGFQNVAIGYSATVNSSVNNSIALGCGANATATSQFVVGGTVYPVTVFSLGRGVTYSAPDASVTFTTTGGSGSNIVASNLIIAPGISTGSATPATTAFQRTAALGPSSTAQTLTTVMTIGGTSDVLVQASASTVVPVTIQGAASQSANILNVNVNGGSALFSFDKLGRPLTGNTTPGIAAGAGAGTSPTVSLAGTDVNGVVSVTSGTLPTGSAVVATITFSAVFASAPKTVILTPANANAAALNGLTMVWVDSAGITTAVWTINVGATGLAAATAYKWYYQVLG